MADKTKNPQENAEDAEFDPAVPPQGGAEETLTLDGDVSLDEALSKQAKKTGNAKKINLTKKQIQYGAGGFVALLLIFMLFSCGGAKGPMEYGVCSTFLEMNTAYPHTLQYTAVEGSQTAIRIYYTSTDPFGQYKSEMIECRFRSDAWQLLEITKNRRQVDPEVVKKFNLLVPSIVAGKPNLDLPPYWKNELIDY
jgi:hypothetical protein